LEKFQQESNKMMATNKQEMLHETLDLRDKIIDLSENLGASVLKQVMRNIQKTINKL